MSRQSTDTLAERIGANIRRARLEAGLTQANLAGGDITRNMLSLIENGQATPSLATLCSIAERLGLPPGALLEELSGYNAIRLKSELSSLLSKGKYRELIERYDCTEPEERFDPELTYILRRAFVMRAEELYRLGRLTESERLLDRAGELPPPYGFDTAQLADRELTLRLLLKSAAGLPYDEREKEKLHEIIYTRGEVAIYLYAREMLAKTSGKAYSVPDENLESYREKLVPLISELKAGFIRSHIEAKLKMAAADYLGAKAKLVTLLSDELPPSLLCELYCDLEHCCKCCGDFENAYKYSTARLELVRRMK